MLAIIGGTGLSELDCFESVDSKAIQTPFDLADVVVDLCRHEGVEIAFLPRHGKEHAVPPHQVNYRANLWALKEIGATQIVAVNAVGGIHESLGPGAFSVPDQIIDYTHGRRATYFEDDLESVTHIDFTHPYTQSLRDTVLRCIGDVNDSESTPRTCLDGGVYGATQGPRLETAAEIKRLRQDGCDMVGMTGMPEAALARELALDYACLALSVNWGAGMTDELISLEEIYKILAQGMNFVGKVLTAVSAATGDQ